MFTKRIMRAATFLLFVLFGVAGMFFLLAYSPDSVNENQLLFEVAKYNFTTYMARG